MRVIDIGPERHDLTAREPAMLIPRPEISKEFFRRPVSVDSEYRACGIVNGNPVPPAGETGEQPSPIGSDHAVPCEHRRPGVPGAYGIARRGFDQTDRLRLAVALILVLPPALALARTLVLALAGSTLSRATAGERAHGDDHLHPCIDPLAAHPAPRTPQVRWVTVEQKISEQVGTRLIERSRHDLAALSTTLSSTSNTLIDTPTSILASTLTSISTSILATIGTLTSTPAAPSTLGPFAVGVRLRLPDARQPIVQCRSEHRVDHGVQLCHAVVERCHPDPTRVRGPRAPLRERSAREPLCHHLRSSPGSVRRLDLRDLHRGPRIRLTSRAVGDDQPGISHRRCVRHRDATRRERGMGRGKLCAQVMRTFDQRLGAPIRDSERKADLCRGSPIHQLGRATRATLGRAHLIRYIADTR